MLIFTESFETDGNGTRYTTSVAEFSDGDFDFFTRTDGSNIGGTYDVINTDGNFFFAAQDVDGEGSASQQTLLFSAIDILGFTNLNFSALFAEDDASDGNQDWDNPDFVKVEYQIDGGGFQNLFAIENDGNTFNSAPFIDTDFDGIGDGSEITSAFTEFGGAIAETGSRLDLRFTINLNAEDEDIAIDKIQITGDRSPVAEIALSSPTVDPDNVLQGTTDRILYQVDLAVATADAELTEATFTTGGTYQTADLVANSFELFYSTDPIFDAGDISLGTQAVVDSGDLLTFTGLSQTIDSDTTGTLFLVADVVAEATPGNTIEIAAPNLNDFTFTSGNKTGTPIAGGVQTFDAIPEITSISSDTADGTFGIGDTVNVTINFSESVTLTGGNLTVSLDSGGTVSISPFADRNTASATYTVSTGENSADLESNTLGLADGATLQDATGNNVTLAIPTGRSLADDRDIIIDTTTLSVPSSPDPSPTPSPTPNPTPTPDVISDPTPNPTPDSISDPIPSPSPSPNPTPDPIPTPPTTSSPPPDDGDPTFDPCQLADTPPTFPNFNPSTDIRTGSFILGDDNPNTLDSRGEVSAIMLAFAGNDNLFGSPGDDVVFANQGADAIDAGMGNDRIFAGQDGDGVRGGMGNDTLAGDLGNDLIFGDEGEDVLFGNRGTDNLDGGFGNDTIYGGNQNDRIFGGEGEDVLLGELGDDCLHGDAGDDLLFGNLGSDVLFGGDGFDVLFGGRENDSLYGGSRTDVLSGDLGDDTLVGGGGGDRFDFRPGDGSDIVTDFTDGVDIIGLKEGLTFADLTLIQVANDTQITATGLIITLQGVNVEAIDSTDFALV
ncbi:MAG: calcium-binding protein [Cyanobacteriota bacterium]|nr:calcium-binding protein [Cyanobacteriota bacterium]